MLLLPGPPPVSVILRRSLRSRRLSLRVSRLDGRVTLSLPPHVREAEAMAFLRAQESWLRRALEKAAGPAPVALGDAIPVEGRMVRLVAGTGHAPRLDGEALILPGDPARAAVRAAAFLKAQARDRLAAASDGFAARVGRRYRTLSLRDTRSRWGSCTSSGGLMFNWRLVMAPPEVLDYVAAHEVAHLVEMNHSPDFWAVVRALMPDYETPRRWLKSEGHELHAYRFGP
ncbi:MAG: M48 family metallopeptidase [Pseudorhodobacter sp.]